MSNDRYQLIDFGGGRKLESFAGHLVDRPCPAADSVPRKAAQYWGDAAARYDATSKVWSHRKPWPKTLDVNCGDFRMPVQPTPFGHVGLFPEQFDNWRWLLSRSSVDSAPKHALNLFAYSGASTMALAIAGYHVAHVDAAKPNVQAARVAAQHNGIAEAPIRYLVDDAAKFAAREVRRERIYHTIVLDPPAYGHGPSGKAWRLERDLWPLLDECGRLIDPKSFRLLITGHSAEIGAPEVTDYLSRSGILSQARDASGLLLDSGRSQLRDEAGRSLDAGFFVRVESRD